jgi:hypothetical protein
VIDPTIEDAVDAAHALSGGLTVSASVSFTVQPGRTKKVKVKLNSKGKSLVEEAGKQGLEVTLTGSGLKPRKLTVR